eukprot:COSAG02_NODE_1184_length_14008_cov_44.301963_3_plen_77_part_00
MLAEGMQGACQLAALAALVGSATSQIGACLRCPACLLGCWAAGCSWRSHWLFIALRIAPRNVGMSHLCRPLTYTSA